MGAEVDWVEGYMGAEVDWVEGYMGAEVDWVEGYMGAEVERTQHTHMRSNKRSYLTSRQAHGQE
jgi:hypothetical protein